MKFNPRCVAEMPLNMRFKLATAWVFSETVQEKSFELGCSEDQTRQVPLGRYDRGGQPPSSCPTRTLAHRPAVALNAADALSQYVRHRTSYCVILPSCMCLTSSPVSSIKAPDGANGHHDCKPYMSTVDLAETLFRARMNWYRPWSATILVGAW